MKELVPAGSAKSSRTAGRPRRRPAAFGDVAKPLRHFEHDRAGALATPPRRVQHAVDGGGRNAGLLRDVDDRSAQFEPFLVRRQTNDRY